MSSVTVDEAEKCMRAARILAWRSGKEARGSQ